jgi:putative Mn2+ efflux pump MntP
MELGRVVGHAASLAGGGLLTLLALYLLIREGSADADDALAHVSRLSGRALWGFALAVSLDELAVGVSLGLTGLGLGLAAVVAVEAFCFAGLGLAWGRRIAAWAGSWADRLAAWVLLLLGLWTLFRAWHGI